jgi:predicted GNAT family N-acyltransferase
MNYQIITTDWKTHQTPLADIRIRVFMQEQAVREADEWDGLDEQATHFLVLWQPDPDKPCTINNPQAIGCARLLNENGLHSKRRFHIGRVALLKDYRGQGIGKQLMNAIVTHCQRIAPEQEIYLHAQTERKGFYRQLGFSAIGEVFMDAGIPHVTMFYRTTEAKYG